MLGRLDFIEIVSYLDTSVEVGGVVVIQSNITLPIMISHIHRVNLLKGTFRLILLFIDYQLLYGLLQLFAAA